MSIPSDWAKPSSKLAADTGAAVLAVPTDISSWPAVEALAMASAEQFGSVHVLCNNAGVTLPGVTWEYSREEWEWVIGVNLHGVVHGIRAFVPSMLAHGEPAHVVNTASIGGLMSFPGLAPYAATKYGVVGLSETLAQDLAERDASVGVSVLCPGPTETELRSHSRALHPEGDDDLVTNDYEGVVADSPGRGRRSGRRGHSHRSVLGPHAPRVQRCDRRADTIDARRRARSCGRQFCSRSRRAPSRRRRASPGRNV